MVASSPGAFSGRKALGMRDMSSATVRGIWFSFLVY
jgi:hypothetical protein